jgi:hydroxymethylpyrimidine/phosphomethylpyrimidine kinase
MTPPIALTIAGSDSSGGAGIQADLKTFSALGVFGASVITAITAQNTLGVRAVHLVPPDMIAAQIDAVFSDLDIRAVKIGMIGDAQGIKMTAATLTARPDLPRIVLDPVMVAASGDTLLEAGAEDTLKTLMLPRADLLTPNLQEAALLLGQGLAESEDDMREQAEALHALGPKAVLVKGGHGTGDESVDILFDGARFLRFTALRVQTRNVHGTGCTLSSAVAAGLALGRNLEDAVREAKTWLTEAIALADHLNIGHGAGPVHHFHALWRRPPA